MYLLYILLTIIVLLLIGIYYFYYKIYELFQNPDNVEDMSGIKMDLSGINVNKLANELKDVKINTTADPDAINSTAKFCNTIQGQIDSFEKTKEQYRSIGDWTNVKITNKTISSLKEQLTTVGCQNYNTQNN